MPSARRGAAQLGRYLLDTDGFSAAYKLQQLLAVGSVVLHPASTWRAYFYRALRPYVNFVPLWHAARDDVLPAVRWLKVHDRRARRIGAAGRRLACSHLTQPARLCYWRRLLRAYAATGRLARWRAFAYRRLGAALTLRIARCALDVLELRAALAAWADRVAFWRGPDAPKPRRGPARAALWLRGRGA